MSEQHRPEFLAAYIEDEAWEGFLGILTQAELALLTTEQNQASVIDELRQASLKEKAAAYQLARSLQVLEQKLSNKLAA